MTIHPSIFENAWQCKNFIHSEANEIQILFTQQNGFKDHAKSIKIKFLASSKSAEP